MSTVQHWDTPIIAAELWPEVFQTLVRVLTDCGVAEVVTWHGLTQSVFADHPHFGQYEWVELRAQVARLPDLLEAREALGFTPGRDDWWWTADLPASGEAFELRLCHESDLHLQTGDPVLALAFADALAPQGVSLSRRESV